MKYEFSLEQFMEQVKKNEKNVSDLNNMIVFLNLLLEELEKSCWYAGDEDATLFTDDHHAEDGNPIDFSYILTKGIEERCTITPPIDAHNMIELVRTILEVDKEKLERDLVKMRAGKTEIIHWSPVTLKVEDVMGS